MEVLLISLVLAEVGGPKGRQSQPCLTIRPFFHHTHLTIHISRLEIEQNLRLEKMSENQWIHWNPQLRILYMAGFRLGPDTTRRVSWNSTKMSFFEQKQENRSFTVFYFDTDLKDVYSIWLGFIDNLLSNLVSQKDINPLLWNWPSGFRIRSTKTTLRFEILWKACKPPKTLFMGSQPIA